MSIAFAEALAVRLVSSWGPGNEEIVGDEVVSLFGVDGKFGLIGDDERLRWVDLPLIRLITDKSEPAPED